MLTTDWALALSHATSISTSKCPMLIKSQFQYLLPAIWTSLADDCILRHHSEVLSGDNVAVTGGSDKDIRAGGSILHSSYLKAFHHRLKGIDGVNLGDDYASPVIAEGCSALVMVNVENEDNLIDQHTPLPTSP